MHIEEYILYAKRTLDDVEEEDNVTEVIKKDLTDVSRTRSSIRELIGKGVADRVDKGLPVPHKDYKALEEIKKEYETFFDEDSGNDTIAGGLKEVEEYLKEETKGLSETYSSASASSDSNKAQEEPKSKKEKIEYDDDLDTGPIEMPSFLDDID
jgi:hypothetical protein